MMYKHWNLKSERLIKTLSKSQTNLDLLYNDFQLNFFSVLKFVHLKKSKVVRDNSAKLQEFVCVNDCIDDYKYPDGMKTPQTRCKSTAHDDIDSAFCFLVIMLKWQAKGWEVDNRRTECWVGQEFTAQWDNESNLLIY